jgi:hypothetical protein
MGRRISEDQKEDTKGYGNERTDNKTTCKGKPGRRQQSKVPEAATADLIKLTLDHFFPDFNVYLNQLPDPRRQDRITYSKEHLFYLGLSMFLFHCGSRNQLESERKTIDFYHNLLTLSKTDEEYTASTDAMNYFMEARCRWQIEEAFNIQKNGGYELEHNFGTVGFAMKNYYYLL